MITNHPHSQHTVWKLMFTIL